MKKREIPFSPPDISDSEINEVIDTLKSGWITTGPKTKLLEKRLAEYVFDGTITEDRFAASKSEYENRVVCLNSATAAEELNLRVYGIQPGDEVIVPAYTYTATASAAVHCGAKLCFVDIQNQGDNLTHMPEMDYDMLEDSITDKVKAIIPVDYAGVVCNYEQINDLVERKKSVFSPLKETDTITGSLSARIQKAIGKVAIIADCAHSLGAYRLINGCKRYCGNIADFSSFSFHAVKNFTTAEGGASVWKPLAGISNKEIYKMYQLLSLHGQSKDALSKTMVGAWEYDIMGPWYKCNMTDIMASIGLRQLDRYPGMLQRRKEIVNIYDSFFDRRGIFHLMHNGDTYGSSMHLYLIRIPGIDEARRNEIITKMAEKGVATNVHYKPLPMMTAYQNMGFDIKDYPNAYDYYKNLITLPLNTRLSDDDITYILDVFGSII